MNKKVPKNPHLVGALNAIGRETLAMACRRLRCPVPQSALVLEVGSRGSSYLRANVLIDAYAETLHRLWTPFTTDRPAGLRAGVRSSPVG